MHTNSILVTGHRGYIGSHLWADLQDKTTHGCTDVLKYTNAFSIDGCDWKDNGDFASIHGKSFDVVVHLAASVSVTESFEQPLKYIRNNCFKLIEFLGKNTVRKLVFASTGGAMYGDKIGAKESDATWSNCKSPYAQSKYLAEEAIRTLCRDYVILRLGNVFGGDYSIRGEASVHAHFAQDEPITVYGGDQTRDFIHVNSVVKALQHAMNNNVQGTFNIASGKETRISEIARNYSQRRSVPIQVLPSRQGEVERITLDCSAAHKAGFAYLQSPHDVFACAVSKAKQVI